MRAIPVSVLIMRKILMISVAAIVCGLAGSAVAVDVVNEDFDTHLIVVTEAGETTSFELAPGQKVLDICEKCSVQIDGTDPVPVEGNQVAVIKGGVINIRKSSEHYPILPTGWR